MTAAEMIDGYVRAGLDVYLDGDDNVVLSGPAGLRAAARPAVKKNRAAIVQELRRQRRAAIEALVGRGVPADRLHGVPADGDADD